MLPSSAAAPDNTNRPATPTELERPVLLVAAVFSRHPEALLWAQERLVSYYGPLGPVSEPFPFHHTAYYQASMGPNLCKQFLTFQQLVAEDCLPPVKHQTIALERELADQQRYPEARPLNIDPGLLTLGKLLLATTKDQAHRIYLGQGIFAEVTLRYQGKRFQTWPWTYADYREPALHAFLEQAREFYRHCLCACHSGNDLPSSP